LDWQILRGGMIQKSKKLKNQHFPTINQSLSRPIGKHKKPQQSQSIHHHLPLSIVAQHNCFYCLLIKTKKLIQLSRGKMPLKISAHKTKHKDIVF
jgi:hypothetical protein